MLFFVSDSSVYLHLCGGSLTDRQNTWSGQAHFWTRLCKLRPDVIDSNRFCLQRNTSVSTALPTLGRVFNDASMASWVGTSYLLTSTACQPVYGRLSDIFGRKSVLLGCLSIFLVGSVLCAVSQSMTMLIVFRKQRPSLPLPYSFQRWFNVDYVL